MKAIVLLNSTAGTLAAQGGKAGIEPVARALSDAGIDATILPLGNSGLTQARDAVARGDVDVVIAGGGDGTLSAVAGIVAGSAIPLGILPLGTLNHFAKDLGIPFDLKEAIRVIADRKIGHVDVGMLNGRVFINNSSLGIYPRVVLEREAHRSRFGLRKWTAMALAMLKVFFRFPMVRVRLKTGEETIYRKTPLVFVGNNLYELDLFRIGKRTSLERGELCLYVANTQNRWGVLRLTLRAMLGRLQQSRDFETFQLTECGIETRRRRMHVAIDGEVIKLSPPLEYRVQPGSLLVCLPPKVVDEIDRNNQETAAGTRDGPASA
jgi:diacylglycerol kinase family enzyme